jgi:hypothetical protein
MKKKSIIIVFLILFIGFGLLFYLGKIDTDDLKKVAQKEQDIEQRNDPVPPGHLDDSMKFVMFDDRYIIDEKLPVTIPEAWTFYTDDSFSFAYPSKYILEKDGNSIIISPEFQVGKNCNEKPTVEDFLKCENPPRTPYIRVYKNLESTGLSLPYSVAVSEKETIGAYAFNKDIAEGESSLGDMMTSYAMYKQGNFYRFEYSAFDVEGLDVKNVQEIYGNELYTMTAQEQDFLLRQIIETVRIK